MTIREYRSSKIYDASIFSCAASPPLHLQNLMNPLNHSSKEPIYEYHRKDQKYIAHAYHRYPVCFVSGKGSILTDEDGKEYIDLGSGIGVDIFGIAHEPWMAAVENSSTR